jgi:alpha-tubulin suppressor-like RCC1 family protein
MKIWLLLFSVPVTVALAEVTDISAGGSHSCALLASGAIKCWGGNYDGQLGDGTTSSSGTAVDVLGISSATSIAVGQSHSCALLMGGTIKCWGFNGRGQLGVGDGTFPKRSTPGDVLGITTATSIALGRDHSCALLAGGAIKCWGLNYNGQFGDGATIHDWQNDRRDSPVSVFGITTATRIAPCDDHSCALLTGGAMKCLGRNGS